MEEVKATKKKIDFENFGQFSLFLVTSLTIVKFLDLYFYYSLFRIDILNFLSYEDIISLMLPSATINSFGLFLIILLMVLINTFDPEFFIINFPEGISLFHKMKIVIKKYMPSIILAMAFFVLTGLRDSWNHSLLLYVEYPIIGIILGGVWIIANHSSYAISKKAWLVIILATITFSSNFRLRLSESYEFARDSKKVSFEYQDRSYMTGNKTYFYIGQTKQNLFLYNVLSGKAIVFDIEKITYLTYF